MSTILHLSDLHFGVESQSGLVSTALSQRKITLDALLTVITELADPWRPDIVVVSGDLGWAGRSADYERAAAWLRTLLEILSLTPRELILCPGNHDVDLAEAEVLVRPSDADRADRLLEPERLERISRPFDAYVAFCKDFGVTPFRIGEMESYLAGTREISDIRCVILNSAWFCRDESDKGNLFIGLPQIDVMESAGQLIDSQRYDEEPLTIGVIHHPASWLHDAETSAYDMRVPVYSHLARRTHLLLSGHTHSGGIADPDRIGAHAWLFVGGAAYADVRYPNNFSVLRIDRGDRTVHRKAYEFDPRERGWRDHPVDQYPLRRAWNQHSSPISSFSISETIDFDVLRERAKRHAERYVESKSRAVASTIYLPALTYRRVGIHDPSARVRRSEGEVFLDTNQHSAPFAEAAKSDRPTFLFGDLGGGKSTIVGQFVADLNMSLEGLLGLLIPARYFLSGAPRDVQRLLEEVTTYVREHVAPDLPEFDLRSALGARQEITLVLDGFDELRHADAEALLASAEEAANLYDRLRVIATGRPIELQALNYSRWQLLETLPLSREEQLALLAEEARADGKVGIEAEADANTRLRALQQVPDLLRLAESPLVLRLVRPQLGTGLSQRTVGDLLFDVLHQRLTDWGEREGKEQARSAFAAALPNGPAREALLGRIAAAVHNAASRTISRHVLASLVEAAVSGASDAARASAEGTAFFRTTFLEGSDDELGFPSQPILQCALGVHIARQVRNGEEHGLRGPPLSLWREVSFAAAVLRRKGVATETRRYFGHYLDELFAGAEANATPFAAAVVAESLDPHLAGHVLRHFGTLGYQPLRYLGERNDPSGSYYARLFSLAGDAGFEWFYHQYLNPRFPIHPASETFSSGVLRYWLASTNFQPTTEQSIRLGSLIAPHLATGSILCHTMLPAIALAVPGSFSQEQLARLAVDALSQVPLRDKAEAVLMDMADGASRNEVLVALEARLGSSSDIARHTRNSALALWDHLAHAERVPIAVARAAVSDHARRGEANEGEPPSRWFGVDPNALLRWYAMSDVAVASDAALLLYKSGERSFSLLAPCLLRGASGYPGSVEAEQALDELLTAEAKRGSLWLAEQFPDFNRLSGPPPTLWRLLMRALARETIPQPQILRYCVTHLGEYTLVRNPDVRRAFQVLLDKNQEYRDSLRDALGSIDRRLRYAAACVLLTCDPAMEIRAAEGVIRGAVDVLQWTEWHRFAMRLALGPSVLQRVKELVPELPSVPRALAVAMLHHNRVPLTDQERTSLVEDLLGEAHWLSRPGIHENSDTTDLRPVFSDREAVPHLLRILWAEAGGRTQRAAEALLEHHVDVIPTRDEARAWVHAYRDSGKLTWPWNERRLKSRLEDSEFTAAFDDAAADLRQTTSQEAGIALLVRSYEDNFAWRDLLWALLVEPSDLHRGSAVVPWVLSRVFGNSAAAAAVGTAAREFLGATSHQEHTDGRGALTLLAHEFGGLPDESLDAGISMWGHDEMDAALLARMNSIPENFLRRRQPGYLLLFAPAPTPSNPISFDQARELTRDSGATDPDALAFLERVILDGALTPEEVSSLAEHGKLGGLTGSVLEFCRGRLPEAQWMVRSLAVSSRVERDQSRVPGVIQVRRILRNTLLEEVGFRLNYVAVLESDLHRDISPSRASVSEPELLLRELLQIKGELSPAEWQRLLEQIVHRPYVLNGNLARQIAEVIVGTGDEHHTTMLQVLRQAGETLAAVNARHSDVYETMALLLVSLGLMALERSETPLGERLFLASLPGLFITKEQSAGSTQRDSLRLNGGEVLNSVAPLLERVSQARIRTCVQAGLWSDLPEVRACCRLLAALSKAPIPLQTGAV